MICAEYANRRVIFKEVDLQGRCTAGLSARLIRNTDCLSFGIVFFTAIISHILSQRPNGLSLLDCKYKIDP